MEYEEKKYHLVTEGGRGERKYVVIFHGALVYTRLFLSHNQQSVS